MAVRADVQRCAVDLHVVDADVLVAADGGEDLLVEEVVAGLDDGHQALGDEVHLGAGGHEAVGEEGRVRGRQGEREQRVEFDVLVGEVEDLAPAGVDVGHGRVVVRVVDDHRAVELADVREAHRVTAHGRVGEGGMPGSGRMIAPGLTGGNRFGSNSPCGGASQVVRPECTGASSRVMVPPEAPFVPAAPPDGEGDGPDGVPAPVAPAARLPGGRTPGGPVRRAPSRSPAGVLAGLDGAGPGHVAGRVEVSPGPGVPAAGVPAGTAPERTAVARRRRRTRNRRRRRIAGRAAASRAASRASRAVAGSAPNPLRRRRLGPARSPRRRAPSR